MVRTVVIRLGAALRKFVNDHEQGKGKAMRKSMKGCLGVVAALIAVHFALAEVKAGVFSECSPCGEILCGPCDEACNPCDAICGPKRASQWNVGGWVEAGLWANQWGRTNSYADGLVAPGNSVLLNNAQHTGVQMNQAWLFVERTVNTRRGFDIGGRVDFVYGTDAYFTQSDGFEYRSRTPNATPWGEGDYGVSFAQAYAEIGVNNLNLKVGKLLTPLGHESIMAPNRFFYSLNYAYYVLPDTHTGAVATWSPSEKFSLIGGWTNGANLTFYNQDNNTAIFGATFTPNKKIGLSYIGGIGREKNALNYQLGPFGTLGPWQFTRDQDYFLQSVVVNVKPNKRWDYTFEWTLINNVRGEISIAPPFATIDNIPLARYSGSYGINQELIYRVNDKWAVGGRFEWMHNYGCLSYNGTHLVTTADADYYGYTFGVNWTPNKWLLVRPEVRYDKVYGGGNPFDAETRDDQVSGGLSAVVKF